MEKKYGKNSEYYGAASSNLSVYICTQNDGRESEAYEHCYLALKTFEKQLGKSSEHTVYALTNCLRILKELGRTDEFNQLKNEFSHLDLDVHFTSPPSPQDFEDYYRDFVDTPRKKSFDPPGYVRTEKMTKDQLNKFVDMWKAQGKFFCFIFDFFNFLFIIF